LPWCIGDIRRTCSHNCSEIECSFDAVHIVDVVGTSGLECPEMLTGPAQRINSISRQVCDVLIGSSYLPIELLYSCSAAVLAWMVIFSRIFVNKVKTDLKSANVLLVTFSSSAIFTSTTCEQHRNIITCRCNTIDFMHIAYIALELSFT